MRVPDVPPWISIWKDTSAAIQSAFTVAAIVAAAFWFYRRRQRFPRADVTHEISHWRVDNRFILHTLVRVKNLGEVALRLIEVSIRAQQVLPTPSTVREALLVRQDPVRPAETEILWPSVDERKVDWSGSLHIVEPGETEEIPIDLVIPVDVVGVEVYTYIRNVRQRRNVGWGTNTLYAFVANAFSAQVDETAPGILTGSIPKEERIHIMAEKRDSAQDERLQKQAPPKTATPIVPDKRQGPEKTSTSDQPKKNK